MLRISQRKEAWAAVSMIARRLKTPAEASELIGVQCALEISPDGGLHKAVPEEVLEAWRERICSTAIVRWERFARNRMVYEEVARAGCALEARARKAGVRLGRTGVDTILDHALERRKGL